MAAKRQINRQFDLKRRRWRSSLLLFVCYILIPPSTYSGPPTPFDNWSVTGGTISAPCPNGFTCRTNVLDDGILERAMTQLSTGRTYVQLILVDGAVNQGGMSAMENFIDMSGLNFNGTSLKHTITQRGEYNVDYTTILNTGWADTPNSPTITINQSMTDTTVEGVGFDTNFEYRANLGPNDAVTGYYFGIQQRVTDSTNLRPGSNSGGTDVQNFVLRRASGNMVPSAGSATLPGAGMGMGGGAGGMGGGGMMAIAVPQVTTDTGTTGGRTGNTSVFTRGNTTGALVTIMGTSTGEGEAPCGSDPPTNLTPGQPPPCSTGIAPSNPGSVGTGSGAGAAAPSGTLTPPPRGSGTIPVPPQPPGADGAIPMGMGGAGVPVAGTVSWGAGDEVQVIWIGQNCPGCVVAGGMGMGMGGSGAFSYQAYENLSTGATAATRSIFGTTPFTWNNPPFGPQPGL